MKEEDGKIRLLRPVETRLVLVVLWMASVAFVYLVCFRLEVSSFDFVDRYLAGYFPVRRAIESMPAHANEALWFNVFFFFSAVVFAVPVYREVFVPKSVDRVMVMLLVAGIILCFAISILGFNFVGPGNGFGRLFPIIFNFGWLGSSVVFLLSYFGFLVFSFALIKKIWRFAE